MKGRNMKSKKCLVSVNYSDDHGGGVLQFDPSDLSEIRASVDSKVHIAFKNGHTYLLSISLDDLLALVC